jgi:hypothetical protein
MRTHLNLEAGTFYSIGQGHVFLSLPVSPGEFELGTKFQVPTMFEMWELLREGKPVGFFFQSPFRVENKGSFIITYMQSKRGKADRCHLVVRNDKDGLMVYDYPGCGSLAVSTKVSQSMRDVLEQQ